VLDLRAGSEQTLDIQAALAAPERLLTRRGA
jgi:hypothetical protein